MIRGKRRVMGDESLALRARRITRKLSSRTDTDSRVRLRVLQRFDAPPERVFDAWLDPAIAGGWLFATATHPVTRVEIDARVGGSFRFLDRRGRGETEYAGEYVEIVRPRRLVFTLSLENDPRAVTRVTADIVPLKSGCELRLVHEDVPPDHASRTEGRWEGMLYGLGTRLGARAR
jgi:uncharacterized protein YndB with AHSA1/START domain